MNQSDKMFRRAFIEKLPRDAIVAEIGVADGSFSLLALEYSKPREYHMIDCWKQQRGDYEIDPCNYPQSKMDKMYKKVVEKFNIYECGDGTRPKVTIHREYSSDAVTSFKDGYFDWVYIDADHTYKGIKADLGLWWPKVKPGGFLAGHDYHAKRRWVDVKRAVGEFLQEKDLKLKYISHAKYPDWAIKKPEAEDSQGTKGACAYPLLESITMVPTDEVGD